MTDEPEQNELDLAKRLERLEREAAVPKISGAGALGWLANEALTSVARTIVTGAALVVLVYYGWAYVTKTVRLYAETQRLDAEAARLAAEAEAQSALTPSGDTVAAAKLKAEIAAADAAAEKAKAEFEAQKRNIDGVTARVATLQTEVELANEEARKAEAEADAFAQRVDGVPVIVLQKKAEVEKLEAQVDGLVGASRSAVYFAQGRNMDGSEDKFRTQVYPLLQKFFRQ